MKRRPSRTVLLIGEGKTERIFLYIGSPHLALPRRHSRTPPLSFP